MITLILGDTKFPKLIIKKLKEKDKKFIIIDLSKKNIFKKEKNSFRFSVGEFGSMLNLIRKKGSNKVLFAGKIHKPNFSKLRLDFKGVFYMPSVIKASKLGDAAIIKSIIKILENEKIKVVRSNLFNPELTLGSGSITKTKPKIIDKRSIRIGIDFFKKTNDLDHIQALVVKNDAIIAKEGREGTKKMLAKLKKKSNAILIKFPKKNQDLRIDLPTIGLESLKDCQKKGIKGIVLKANKNIFLEKVESINFANKNKIFIHVI